MKKLFSFVCALVCAMSLSAKTIYLNAGGSSLWDKEGAVFVEDISDKDMTAVEGAFGYYQVSIEDSQTKVKFLRMKGDKNTQWNATNELTIPTDGNDCYTITGWGAGDGNWSKYTTPDPIDPSSIIYSIKHPWGGGTWSYKDLTPNEDGTYSIRDIYGGEGCNWKSTVSREEWIGSPTLEGNPVKGDSAIFTLTSTKNGGAITITKIASTGGEGGGTDPEPATNDTVFFVNTYGWKTVKCYAWTDGKCENATYPGVQLTEKCNYQLQGADVYFYVAEQGKYAKCLFNCGGDECKSVDLTWDAGKYFCKGAWKTRAELESDEPIEDVITYGIGSNKNGYNSDNDPMTVSDDQTTATCTIELTKDETFEFSVVVIKNGTSATWLKNTTTTITRESNSATLAANNEENNTSMTVDVTGTYTFVFTIGNSTITVTYPSSTPTALSNTEAEKATVKVIRNGQVLIVREGVTYNMMGQVIQ